MVKKKFTRAWPRDERSTPGLHRMRIGSTWDEGSSGECRNVFSPSTGKVIGQIAIANRGDAKRAISLRIRKSVGRDVGSYDSMAKERWCGASKAV